MLSSYSASLRQREVKKMAAKIAIIHPADLNALLENASTMGISHRREFYGEAREKHIFYSTVFGVEVKYATVFLSGEMHGGECLMWDETEMEYMKP